MSFLFPSFYIFFFFFTLSLILNSVYHTWFMAFSRDVISPMTRDQIEFRAGSMLIMKSISKGLSFLACSPECEFSFHMIMLSGATFLIILSLPVTRCLGSHP